MLVFKGHLSTNSHTWWKLHPFIPRLATGKCFSFPMALPALVDIYWEKNIRYSKCRPDLKSGRRAKNIPLQDAVLFLRCRCGCVEEVAMIHGKLNGLRKCHLCSVLSFQASVGLGWFPFHLNKCAPTLAFLPLGSPSSLLGITIIGWGLHGSSLALCRSPHQLPFAQSRWQQSQRRTLLVSTMVPEG